MKVKCEYCGSPIYSDLITCPHCGAPVPEVSPAPESVSESDLRIKEKPQGGQDSGGPAGVNIPSSSPLYGYYQDMSAYTMLPWLVFFFPVLVVVGVVMAIYKKFFGAG